MSYQYLVGRELYNGKYRIVAYIGAGGMSEVYEGWDTDLNRKVAIKILKTLYLNDPYYKRRFREEARIAADCDHPHIVKIFDRREEDSIHYIAMQYLPKSLSTLLKIKKVFTGLEAITILRDIAEALVYVHKRGIVHRDIKIGNIMFDEHNNPILTDFGIATREDSTMLAQGTLTTGTPEYMSPEQIKGKNIDFRSDIYSLGIVLYELITGSTPFSAEDPQAVFWQHINEPIPEQPLQDNQVPKRIKEIIYKCLAKSPDGRYQSTQALIDAFDDILRNPPTPKKIRPPHKFTSEDITLKPQPGEQNSIQQKRIALKPTLIIPILIVLLVAVWYIFRQENPKPRFPLATLYISPIDSATNQTIPFFGKINFVLNNPNGPKFNVDGFGARLDFYQDTLLIFSKDTSVNDKYINIDKIIYSLSDTSININIQVKMRYYETIFTKIDLFKNDAKEIKLKLQPIDIFCGKCGNSYSYGDTICSRCLQKGIVWKRKE